MSAKIIYVLCAQALLIQSAFSQCTSRAAIDATGYPSSYNRPGYGYNRLTGPAPAYQAAAFAGRSLASDGLYSPAGPIDFTPTSGGGLQVTSSSAIPPTGISVVSENAYEGTLSVAGELPFVGTTDVEGVVPSAGAGATNHACGNGVTVMASDSAVFAPDATAIVPDAAAITPATVAIAPAAAAIAPAAAAIAPAAAAIAPAAAVSPASPFGLGAGFSPANRFGNFGCGGRGFYY